jgi:periplasmic protein TonB
MPEPLVKKPEPEEVTYTSVQKMPHFPGGRDAMLAFLQRELQDYVTEEGQARQVTIEFVVEKDGSLSGLSITESDDEGFSRKVTKAFQKMPRWSPGQQNNQPVKVLYRLPVKILPAED